jgi:hypothetical protein
MHAFIARLNKTGDRSASEKLGSQIEAGTISQCIVVGNSPLRLKKPTNIVIKIGNHATEICVTL